MNDAYPKPTSTPIPSFMESVFGVGSPNRQERSTDHSGVILEGDELDLLVLDSQLTLHLVVLDAVP